MVPIRYRMIAIAVVLSTAAVAMAAKYDTRIDGIYYTLQEGGKATVVFGDDKYTGKVTIPNEFDCAAGDFTVVAIAPKAFVGCKELTEVSYGSTITSIGEGAFQGCEKLNHFTVNQSVTFIANSAFENSGLEEIVIPEQVLNIGDNVFRGCKSLKSAVVENKQIGENQFANCIAMETVSLLGGNVTSIKKKAFSRCIALTSVVIPESVTKIEQEVFIGCEKLQSAEIRNATVASKQFVGCKQLKELTLTENLTLIEEKAFSGCEGLSAFRVPAKLQVIRDEAFLNCSGLKTVDLGSSLTHIGKKAFAGCIGIEELSIPASVKTFGDATFQGRKRLKEVRLENACLSESEFMGCESLQQVIFNVVPFRIPKNAFSGCVALPSVVLPEGVSTVEYNAYHVCKALKELVLPSTIEQIGAGAFSGCVMLSHIRCLAVQVPVTGGSAFSGIAKEGLRIEVPEASIEPYKLAAGWRALQPKEGQVFFPIE